MDVAAKMEMYDILFNIGQQTIDYYDPCGWKNGTCRRMHSSKEPDKGCCEGCKHLNPKGCTVRSLDCKLWFCEVPPVPKECPAELKILRLVAEYCGVPIRNRKSKEENFAPYFRKGSQQAKKWSEEAEEELGPSKIRS